MSAARTTSPDHTGTGSGTPTPGPVSAHPARRWLVLGAVLLVAGGAIVWWLLAGADGSVGAGRTAVIQPGQAGGGVIFPVTTRSASHCRRRWPTARTPSAPCRCASMASTAPSWTR